MLEKEGETQAVKEEVEVSVPEVKEEIAQERVPEAEAETNAELKEDSASVEADTSESFGGVCEELGIPEAKKEEGEVLPEVIETGKSDFTMVNVSRDTHSRLKLLKAKSDAKSFDAVIRKAFGW